MTIPPGVPEVSFHTAWVKSSRKQASRFTSALGGKADEIGAKADIESSNLSPKYCWLLGWLALVRSQIRQERAESILGGFGPQN